MKNKYWLSWINSGLWAICSVVCIIIGGLFHNTFLGIINFYIIGLLCALISLNNFDYAIYNKKLDKIIFYLENK